MESNARTTSSTAALPVRVPGATGHAPRWNDDRSPADRLAFMAASYVRGQHIPTARTAAGSYTRASLAAAIEADASENDRVIPKFPSQRRSPEQPAPVPGQRQGAYDRELLGFQYDGIAADAAFGGAA